MNYFVILEIPITFDAELVKKAYRQAALKHHPDRNPGDQTAAERFKKVTEAFEFLSNPRNLEQHARECQQSSGFKTHHQTKGTGCQPTTPPEQPKYRSTNRNGYEILITPDGFEIPLVPGMTIERFNYLIKNDPNLTQLMTSNAPVKTKQERVVGNHKQTFGMDQSHLFDMPIIRKNH